MGKELCTKNISGSLDKKVRHLSPARSSFARYSFNATHIRSYFYAGYWCQDAEINQFSVEALVPNYLCPWALDLAWSKIKSLPDSIGGLLHLRYLNLSYNEDLEVLPNSIAKLYNLQTLQLMGCKRLEGLPKHLSRLVKLQPLNIDDCNNVTYMPKGMGKLTCLHTLSKFIVDGEGSCSSWKQWFDGLEDLKALNNLKGRLEIQIRWPKHTTDAVKENIRREGLYLNHKEHINHIVVDFRCAEGGGRVDDEEARRLMEELRPHPYLENLVVKAYHGAKMPGWVTLLTNLTELFLSDIGELEYLPCLGNLDHLKVLRLWHLAKLEYIEEDSSSANLSCRPGPESAGLSLYFLSLERLELKRLRKLKGWRRGKRLGDDHQPLKKSSSNIQVQLQLRLPQLKSLRIERCPLLTFLPLCPKTEKLHLVVFNERLRIVHTKRDEKFCYAPLQSSSCDPKNPRSTVPIPMLREVYINNVAWLNSLPMEAFRCLAYMTIKNDKVESLGEVGEVFRSCSSSLRSLGIRGCSNLRSVSGGLEHLTALEILEIFDTHKLSLSEDIEDVAKSLHHSLWYVQLMNLPQLLNLPNSMQFLASLRYLSLVRCSNLESVPDWMPRLTSLKELMISYCSAHLERICQNPTVADWPNIQHIPSIDITSSHPKLLVLPYE
ncbi:disease resistance protein RGA2 [Beta vulgaris subsp. vulgaris]|uniref:disease resistance protein RGA2 n=1 Tax=Beta vulgaris subsp. vulgaris TaxID=3555 RepID=UPI00053FF1DF|nr:disease resistance protein RGA2 [Beta vulgaris subsp. vulgaris]